MEKKKMPRHKMDAPIPKGDIHFEISFYEGLLQKDPNFVEALMALAHDYTLVGRYSDGLNADRKLAELLPNEPTVHYNLACSLTLTDQLDEAGAALMKSVELGYEDMERMEKDPDLLKLRNHPIYHEIRKKFFKSGRS